jgi:predicted nucleic acid-binding protein
MGIRDALRGKRAYLDTNIIIYLMEGYEVFERQLLDIRDGLAAGEIELVTSELTLCEALVVPFRENDSALITTYRQFIEESGAFDLRSTNREIYVRASLYRAQFGMKTPDAIHVATALEANCDIFLTNDRPLKAPKSMKIIRLNDF